MNTDPSAKMNYKDDKDATLNLAQGQHTGADTRDSTKHTVLNSVFKANC